MPIADPALTDAIEFDDGKLIVGKHATVAEVSYENIRERVGEVAWRVAWQSARFVAMVNWTMLPYLTEVWRQIQSDIAQENDERKTLFFDLADPEKRTASDVREALLTLAKFQEKHDVILGLNEKEAGHAADALDLPMPDEDSHEGRMMRFATAIRERLQIDTCVVHPTQFAAACDASGACVASGPFTAQPKISTGAGDHFNAGFCAGRLAGLNLQQSLQTGVATSGYYVRNAQSPDRAQLIEFLQTLGC